MNTSPTTHVALIAFPFSSHPASLFALARSLAAAAPTASFSFLCTPRTLAPLAPAAASLPNLRLHPVPDGCPSPPPANVDVQIGMFFGAAPGNIRTALEAASAELPVSCVVSDAFVWLAAGVAEGMGVPWVPVWTANPAALWAHIHTDLIRATIAAAAGEESQGLAPGLHPAIRVKDLPLQVTSGDLHSGVAGLLYRMGQELHRGAALVTNTFPALDPSIDAGFREKFSNYLPMGPFDLLKPPPGPDGNDESGCLSWLDRWPPNSVAYVSFSTIMAPPPAELAGLAEGLEASGVPFLWSLGEGLRQHLPAGFVERNKAQGLVVAWAPQVRVLAHPAVGVLVNHCGWNSVLECVAGGVPMACRPLLADNMMNERLLTRVLGVGVEFEGGVMSKESTVRALDTFFKAGGTDEGEKMRERMREIKGMAAAAVGDGGCSATNVSRLLQIASMHADPTYHQI